jgi:hypothetical protein
MSDPESSSERPTTPEKAWAVARIVLGPAQVMGATASAYLLVQTGPSTLTLGAVAITGLLVVVSKLLYREPAGPGGTL